MISPTIHLNGTSREQLLEQVTEAANALRTALNLIQEAHPNARDYYPQGPTAYRDAEAEHQARSRRVQEVLAEYVQLAETIAG